MKVAIVTHHLKALNLHTLAAAKRGDASAVLVGVMAMRSAVVAFLVFRLALISCILQTLLAEDDPVWKALDSGKSGRNGDLDSPVKRVGAKVSATASDAVAHAVLSQAPSSKVLKFPTCIYRKGKVIMIS